jgi:hypothetical protein
MQPVYQKVGLLGFLRKFWIGRGAAIKFLLSLVPLFVHHAGGGVHFGAGFLGPAQVLQQLPAQVMDAGTSGIEFDRGINFSQGLSIFSFTLINLSQLVA